MRSRFLPKRKMAAGSRLPVVWGAPLGDNMMTGTVGLLEALRLRKNWALFSMFDGSAAGTHS
jgi:hypothetical protein